jgi:hypothetical protein
MDLRQGVLTVFGLAHDFDVRKNLKLLMQGTAGNRLVIYDQRPDGPVTHIVYMYTNTPAFGDEKWWAEQQSSVSGRELTSSGHAEHSWFRLACSTLSPAGRISVAPSGPCPG